MPISDYLRQVRQKVGHDLLVLPSAAVVLKDAQGRVLFGLHSDKNVWVVPGGLIEPGELPADAALRETWEETGLIAEITGILGVFGGPDLVIHYPNGDIASYVGTIFRGRIIGGELKPDDSEILDAKFLSRDEIMSLHHSKWMDLVMDVLYSTTPDQAQFQPSTWRP